MWIHTFHSYQDVLSSEEMSSSSPPPSRQRSIASWSEDSEFLSHDIIKNSNLKYKGFKLYHRDQEKWAPKTCDNVGGKFFPPSEPTGTVTDDESIFYKKKSTCLGILLFHLGQVEDRGWVHKEATCVHHHVWEGRFQTVLLTPKLPDEHSVRHRRLFTKTRILLIVLSGDR